MKNLKIVTYCTWTSIGSVLQALGLKKALENIGYKSLIIMNRKENEYSHTRVRSVKSLAVRAFEALNCKKRRAAFKKRSEFIENNIDIEYYDRYEELRESVQRDSTEIFLAGSDQIWNPSALRPEFFLEFADGKKKVTYAASMGSTSVPDDKKELFSKYVNSFDSISVREEECKKVIGRICEREASVNIDPTFLVSADEWRKYQKEYKVHSPYILLYMLYWNDSCKEEIIRLKKETGLPVYAITNGLTHAYADKYLYDVGVDEFLWLVDNAEYFVTSSFHGVAFAAIFNKKFAPVVNPASPSRIENILRVLSIPVKGISELCGVNDFDYERINKAIDAEREKSINYLNNVLNL